MKFKGVVGNVLTYGVFLTLSLIFLPQISHAAILDTGEIGTCGELAAPGTYTITTDVGTTSETCFTVTSSGVIINGSSTNSIIGNVVGNRSNYTISNIPSTGDLSIFYYNNNAADGEMFNQDGTVANGSTGVTLSYVCYQCHKDADGIGGPRSTKTLEQLSAKAAGYHD